MTGYISLSNWERFQHYKDRDPPWVKFYRDVLTSESWVLGTDKSRLVQSASVLLAARYANKIPLRFDLIKKVASLDMGERDFNEAIKHLADTKFLEVHELTVADNPVEQNASTVLATCTSEESRDRAEQSRAEGDARASARRPSKHVPENFAITPEMRQWAATECPSVDIDLETKKFRDHEFKSAHTDWPKAWRRWMRTAPEFRRSGNGMHPPQTPVRRWRPTDDEAADAGQ